MCFYIDPENVGIITVLYFGTNLFLVASTIHYLIYRMQEMGYGAADYRRRRVCPGNPMASCGF